MSRVLQLVLVLIVIAPCGALAHAVGEDYVFFRFEEDGIEGHFEIHTGDLRSKLGIELSSQAESLLEDVVASAGSVHEYILENFAIGPLGGPAYEIAFTHEEVLDLPQGVFAQYHFRIESGPLPDVLSIRHSMFYEDDRLHRGLVLVEYNAKTDTSYPGEYAAMVFSPRNPEQSLDLTDIPAIMGPREMIPQGVLHIWAGIDHILFLVALILPTVLVRQENGWTPVDSFPKAAWSLLKIVTVFTIAHSATLLLAALDLISMPSRLVESIIALSIILVALNNIFGKVKEGSLWIILVLGLFHGLGFASVMGHLPFRVVDLLKVVVGFNIGVEIGQVIFVGLLFPLLYALRRWPLYQPVALRGVSAVLIVVSTWWFVQRALGLG